MLAGAYYWLAKVDRPPARRAVGALAVLDVRRREPRAVGELLDDQPVDQVGTRLVQTAACPRGRWRTPPRRVFVIDCGKVLAKAIPGDVRRQGAAPGCRRHKERSVLDDLPEVERPLVQRRLRAAWALEDASAAERASWTASARPATRASARWARRRRLAKPRRRRAHEQAMCFRFGAGYEEVCVVQVADDKDGFLRF